MVLVLWAEKETCGYCEVNHHKGHLCHIVTIMHCGKGGDRATRFESNAMTRSHGKQPEAPVLKRYKHAAAAAAAAAAETKHKPNNAQRMAYRPERHPSPAACRPAHV